MEAKLRPSKLSIVVTVWYWTVFFLTSHALVVLCVIIWLGRKVWDPKANGIHALVSRWIFSYLHIWPGWHVEVTGRERLPKGPAVFVANHQSMSDIVVLMGLKHPFKFVSKASLMALPYVGWVMRMARYIGIERGKPKSTLAMMEACGTWIRRGVSVLIFPEGSYGDGSSLLPFRRGAFELALQEGVPVVPIYLYGTKAFLDEDGPWMSPRCEIRMVVGEAIENLSAIGDAEAISLHVRGKMVTTLSNIVQLDDNPAV